MHCIVCIVDKLSFQALKVSSRRNLLYLMNDKWTLKTTFAGAIIKQVGLDLIQRGKSSATRTTRERNHY